jgi:hypothetical protein
VGRREQHQGQHRTGHGRQQHQGGDHSATAGSRLNRQVRSVGNRGGGTGHGWWQGLAREALAMERLCYERTPERAP